MTTLDAMDREKDVKHGHHVPTDRELGVPDEHTMSGMDYAEHERTYAGFLRLTKWGVITVVIVLVLMALFLT